MAAAVADVIQHFITAMDSLKLNMTAVDQVGWGLSCWAAVVTWRHAGALLLLHCCCRLQGRRAVPVRCCTALAVAAALL
jgi:hypothetical protein